MTPAPDPSFAPTEQGPIATWLVSGFLGAGKTTFILERLKRRGARIAVLVNEFGELGIDGALIREQGDIDLVELPGGCICCSQKEGVAESIRRIASQLRPELLLIEPSGIAETSELITLLTVPSLRPLIRLDAAITVLDAETFLEYSEPEVFGSFFLDQIVHAHLILVNKADLVGEDLLREVEQRLALLNPDALLQRTAFCHLPGEPPAGGRLAPPAGPAHLPSLECVSIVPDAELTETRLELFLSELSRDRFGRVLRGKGLLPVRGRGCLNLQVVAHRANLEQYHGDAMPRLTLIGHQLDGERLRAFFGQAAKEINR